MSNVPNPNQLSSDGAAGIATSVTAMASSQGTEHGQSAASENEAPIPTWALNMQRQFNSIQVQMTNIEARQVNNTARHLESLIRFPSNAEGLFPTGTLPKTKGDLFALNSQQLEALITFYGLNKEPESTQCIRLMEFVGIFP